MSRHVGRGCSSTARSQPCRSVLLPFSVTLVHALKPVSTADYRRSWNVASCKWPPWYAGAHHRTPTEWSATPAPPARGRRGRRRPGRTAWRSLRPLRLAFLRCCSAALRRAAPPRSSGKSREQVPLGWGTGHEGADLGDDIAAAVGPIPGISSSWATASSKGPGVRRSGREHVLSVVADREGQARLATLINARSRECQPVRRLISNE